MSKNSFKQENILVTQSLTQNFEKNFSDFQKHYTNLPEKHKDTLSKEVLSLLNDLDSANGNILIGFLADSEESLSRKADIYSFANQQAQRCLKRGMPDKAESYASFIEAKTRNTSGFFAFHEKQACVTALKAIDCYQDPESACFDLNTAAESIHNWIGRGGDYANQMKTSLLDKNNKNISLRLMTLNKDNAHETLTNARQDAMFSIQKSQPDHRAQRSIAFENAQKVLKTSMNHDCVDITDIDGTTSFLKSLLSQTTDNERDLQESLAENFLPLIDELIDMDSRNYDPQYVVKIIPSAYHYLAEDKHSDLEEKSLFAATQLFDLNQQDDYKPEAGAGIISLALKAAKNKKEFTENLKSICDENYYDPNKGRSISYYYAQIIPQLGYADETTVKEMAQRIEAINNGTSPSPRAPN